MTISKEQNERRILGEAAMLAGNYTLDTELSDEMAIDAITNILHAVGSPDASRILRLAQSHYEAERSDYDSTAFLNPSGFSLRNHQ